MQALLLKSRTEPELRSLADATREVGVPMSTWYVRLICRIEILASFESRQLSARALRAVSLRSIAPDGKLPIRSWQPVPKRAVLLAFA